MLRFVLFFSFCLFFTGRAMATVELGKAPDPLGEFEFIRVPLKRAGNLVLMEAKVDGQLGYFILDTGAPYLVLNETYFGDGQVTERRVMSDVNGGSDTVNVINVTSFELRSLKFDDLEADLTDLGAIENSRGVKILGLLGLNMFLQLEMRLDLRSLALELHRINKEGATVAPLPACASSPVDFDFKIKNNVLLLKGEINDQKLTFCFDTGAEITILSNTLKDDVFEAVTITNSMPLMGSSGKAVYVLQGNLTSVDFGVPLTNCRVVISDLSRMSNAFGVPIDGMIGFDLLARGAMVLNFKKRTLTFCPIL
ncbi:MAG: aspartyl protease family protein [Flavobacteriales bacterium]|nr:aspartyl protease family protein [Flavobacteriales bacterium]